MSRLSLAIYQFAYFYSLLFNMSLIIIVVAVPPPPPVLQPNPADLFLLPIHPSVVYPSEDYSSVGLLQDYFGGSPQCEQKTSQIKFSANCTYAVCVLLLAPVSVTQERKEEAIGIL